MAGIFAGNAYISAKKNAYRLAVTYAKREAAEQEDEVKHDQSSDAFSETEAESGGPDEGTEPDIHWYARVGDVDGVKREIAKGVSVELKNNKEWGSRPLHRAAANANPDVIRFLVSQGADVRAKNDGGWFLPIHFAAQRGCAECIRVLLEAGSPVDPKDRYGFEPIQRAAENGDAESIKVLLAAGANVSAHGGPHEQHPIHEAARAGHCAALEVLLAHGADPNAETRHGSTALYYASDHKNAVRILQAAGAKMKPTEAEKLAAVQASKKKRGLR